MSTSTRSAILFGVASFHGNAIRPRIAQALSYLHHNHLAPPDLRVRAVPERFAPRWTSSAPEERRAQIEALRQIPALIKAYIRLGGFVGEGAYHRP